MLEVAIRKPRSPDDISRPVSRPNARFLFLSLQILTASPLCSVARDLLKWVYVFCLRTFLALSDFHGYLLTFMKSLSARTIDSAEMYEYIFATFLFNKTETLLVVKPLNGTLN